MEPVKDTAREEPTGASLVSDIREWNAASYHRVANPHVDWGRTVLDRLHLQDDETVLDAGCGTGRLTELLLERLPRGRVIALDQSANMLERARAVLEPRFGHRVTFMRRDLLALDLDQEVDVIFSTATFHWIRNHPALFRALFRALRPGGRLVAQCGGGPNIATVAARAMAILRSPRYAPIVGDWVGPWEFADAETTANRLRAAGLTDVVTELMHAPVTMPGPTASSWRPWCSARIWSEFPMRRSGRSSSNRSPTPARTISHRSRSTTGG